jgi:hypothetical protein
MANVTYIGYHATQKENQSKILNNGFEISVSSNKNIQWLGNGVYFWLDDYYAVEWNIINAKSDKKEYVLNNYAILESILICDRNKIFDVSSPEGSYLIKQLRNGLKKILINDNKKEMVKQLDNASDKYFIKFLEDYKLLEDFDMILATYRKKNIDKAKYLDNFIEWEQRQICVKKLSVIKRTKRYTDKERIQQLFDSIIKNRKNILRRVTK